MIESWPEEAVDEIREFLEKRKSGNIQLNIEHGEIKGCRFEYHLRFRRKRLQTDEKRGSLVQIK